jgi:hypothetical protein
LNRECVKALVRLDELLIPKTAGRDDSRRGAQHRRANALGNLDTADPHIAAMLGEANQRIQRDLMWAGCQATRIDIGRGWSWSPSGCSLLTAAALLIPVLLSFRFRR